MKLSTTEKKILQYNPFQKDTYRSICHCYDNIITSDNKPLRLVVDSRNRIVYCNHCGNMIEPFLALEMLVKDWDKIQKAQDDIKSRLKRTWKICKEYRPRRKAMKYIEHQIGNGKADPVCPYCHEAFKLEEINTFRCYTKNDVSYSSSGHDVTNIDSIR